MAKTKNVKNIVVTIVSIVLILVIAVVGYGWIQVMPGYLSTKNAISNYFTAVSKEDSKLYKRTCYTVKWRDVGMDAQITEALSLQSGATYGEVTIVSEEKLDKDYATRMTDSLASRYSIQQKISAIKRVNFKVNMVFDGQSESSGTITRYCYKSGGKWFFLSDPEVINDIGVEDSLN